MENIYIKKSKIRQRIKNTRASLSTRWILESSRCIHQRALGLSEYLSARFIAAYYALPNEVQTNEIFKQCWHDGKEIFVPVYEPKKNAYSFSKVGESSLLREGPYNINEPVVHSVIGPDLLTLVFVPGVAFDPFGGRIGYGKGHFDKLLQSNINLFKVGLAFDFQVLEHVPVTKSDIAMNAIVTNTRIIKVDVKQNRCK